MREGGLVRWQWSVYPNAHRDRRNLALHAATAPLYLAGTCALLLSPVLGLAAAVGGAGAMVVTMAVQGRGHKLEKAAPATFRGPGDVIVRLFTEQWVNFPRFVLSGGFAAAWRQAK